MRGRCFNGRSRSIEKTTPEVFSIYFQWLAISRRGRFFANAMPQALEPRPSRRPISARLPARTRRARFCENVPLDPEGASGGKVFSEPDPSFRAFSRRCAGVSASGQRPDSEGLRRGRPRCARPSRQDRRGDMTPPTDRHDRGGPADVTRPESKPLAIRLWWVLSRRSQYVPVRGGASLSGEGMDTRRATGADLEGSGYSRYQRGQGDMCVLCHGADIARTGGPAQRNLDRARPTRPGRVATSQRRKTL